MATTTQSVDRDDPLIAEVRAVRQALADEFDVDVDRLCEHLKSLDEQYHARIRKPVQRAEAAVDSVQRYHSTILETCTRSLSHVLEWDVHPSAARAQQRARFDALVAYFRDDAAWRGAASHGSLPAEVMGYPIESVREHVLKLSHAREIARQVAQLVVRVRNLGIESLDAEAAEFIRRDLRALREAAMHVREACPLQGVPIVDPATWRLYFSDPLNRGLEMLDERRKH